MNPKMISFADNFEDVLLRRAFPGVMEGFYIDVGAYDPVEHSVTKHFYDSGWRGINIEPNPAPFATLLEGRPRDINLKLGLSNREGRLTLFEAPSTCWSADRDLLTGYFGANPADLVERSIEVTTLAQVCDRHVPPGVTIDFLKVDVEGHEHEVIQGGDWSRHRPRIVLAESNDAHKWEPTLLASGYLFAFFDGVNRLYVREEDRHLIPRVSVPVNTSDNFWIHGYLQRINELEAEVRHFQQYPAEPTALGYARHLFHRVSRRHPRASSMAKRFVRKLTG